MLVLTRKKEESILIGEDIEIVIVEVGEDKVKIGINAPKTMKIFRKELLEQVQNENVNAKTTKKPDVGILKELIK